MGTNFYVGDIHIGKRSAAGPYCWECAKTLCVGGEENVHKGHSEWFEQCPVCGQLPITEDRMYTTEDLSESAAGRELGFNKTPPHKKHGVKSCASFTWAILPRKLRQTWRRGEIRDEYDKLYTWDEFQRVLEECPIRFYGMIGQEFI